MKEISAAIFDLDGTIKTREGIPDEVIKGFESLWVKDITTTIMTGKGRAHLERALSNNWSRIISHDAPVGLENGGRITDSSGTENIRYHALSKPEVDAQITLIETGEIPFLLYVPEQLPQKARIWMKDESTASQFSDSDFEYYDIFTSSPADLHRRIAEDNPCMFVFQPYTQDFRNSIPHDLNVVSNEGVLHLNATGVHKGSGVADIAEIMGTPFDEILIAGNDENDIAMFELPVGRKVLVGSYEGLLTIPDTIQVPDVVALGTYLSQVE